MAVTADNASNNWTMCASLAKILPVFRGTKSYVRCFVHILNLIVMASFHLCLVSTFLISSFVLKAILSPFMAKKAQKGKNGQSVGAIEDTKLEELLEATEDNEDGEDEEAIDGQDKDHQAADEALMEEVVDTPDYTIDIDDAKENIRTGKLSMSKVRVPLPTIRSS